jgi:hypothetical protein
MEDPYEFLAEHYGVTEQQVLDCIDETFEILGDEGDSNQIATLVAQTVRDSKSLFKFLRSMVGMTDAKCNERGVSFERPPFSFKYEVEDDGVVNSNISFQTPRGVIGISMYRGVMDEFDPFQEEPFEEITVSLDDSSVPGFHSDEVFEWTGIPVEFRFALEEVPGLADTLDERSVATLIAEMTLFARYLRKKCA